MDADTPCVRARLKPEMDLGDSMLLGADLEKSRTQILAAYNDELGVAAAFSLNMLARINRELNANFDSREFSHVARIHAEARSVEMHRRSNRRQTVSIPAEDLIVEFQKGETIWTGSSHKYSLDEILEMAHNSGFSCDAQWIDDEWPFAESLLTA